MSSIGNNIPGMNPEQLKAMQNVADVMKMPGLNFGSKQDVKGAGKKNDTGQTGMTPDLPKPEPNSIGILDISSMMVKLMQSQFKGGAEGIKAKQTKVNQENEKRMEELSKYHENMAKSKKGGFFSNLFRAIGALFKGDFKSFGEHLGTAFKENPVLGSLFCVTVGFALLTGGPLCALTTTACFIPFMMTDSGMGDLCADVFGGDAQTWSLALGITGGVLMIAEMIALYAVTKVCSAGAAPTEAMLITGIGVAVGVAAGAMAVEAGAKQIEGAVHSSNATKNQANMQEYQADIKDMQGDMDKIKDYMQTLMSALQNLIGKTADTIQAQGDADVAAAQSSPA